MNNDKIIRQAVFAALCGHPDAEKIKQRALSGSLQDSIAATEAMSRQLKTLTADILLTQDDSGKPMLDTPEAWKSFDKVIAALESCGVRLTYENFLRPLKERDTKTLIDLAIAHNGIEKLFSFQVWRGRFDEMQRVWFLLPTKHRNEITKKQGAESMRFKRLLLTEEGRTAPEDRLIKAGLTPADIRAAFSANGNLVEVNKKLHAVGDYLRKEFALMPDNDGDSVFDNRKDAWDKYGSFVDIMHANGERFEIADFICQYHHAKSVLARAAEHNVLDKVFTPAHWKDRLKDMLDLWNVLLPGWKGGSMMTRDFDSAYAEAENLTFMPRLENLSVIGKQALLTRINSRSEDEKPVLPLGLKAIWEKMDIISQELKQQGDPLAIEDLRRTSGVRGETCLVSAVKYGCFDKVSAICRESNFSLTVDDLVSCDATGTMLIDLLADRNQLTLAFAPEIWAGRIGEMRKLWSHVASRYRTQVNYEQAEVSVRQETLKSKKSVFRLKKPPAKPKP